MGQARNWTNEEYAILRNFWGSKSIPAIAEQLGRSPNAIRIKADRLDLGPVLESGDYITLNQLVIAVTGNSKSYSYHMKSWVQNRGLPVHTKKVERCSFRVVYIDEFWKWAKENRSFIDFSKFEPFSLGEEPEWVAEQRKKDYQSFRLQRKDPWTPLEDEQLKQLLAKQKYGYSELSKLLHRSAGAIQRRCTDLGLKARPVRADNHGDAAKWTDEQFEFLAEGIKNGDGYMLIAEKIGKSEKAIRGKVYFMYLTEDADKVRKMLGSGKWGDGAPEPLVKQGVHLSRCRAEVKRNLSRLAGLLQIRRNELGYEPYWQKEMCVHWDNLKGCTKEQSNCDECTEFERIRPQYCVRCGRTFFERKQNKICASCRLARAQQARKKWAIMNRS